MQFSGEVLYDGATRYGHVFLSANGANFSSFLFVECSGPAYQNFGTLNQGDWSRDGFRNARSVCAGLPRV